MTEVAKIRCWRIGSTDKALLVTLQSRERDPRPKGIWIAKSMCEHISTVASEPGQWPELVVTLPEWIAEKKGLLQ